MKFLTKDLMYGERSNRILPYFDKYAIITCCYSFVEVHCKEHKKKEYIPYYNYWYDLRIWYEIGKHPRFSVLAILAKNGMGLLALNTIGKWVKEILQKTNSKREFEKLIKPFISKRSIKNMFRMMKEPTVSDFQFVENKSELWYFLKKAGFSVIKSLANSADFCIEDENYIIFSCHPNDVYCSIYVVYDKKAQKVIQQFRDLPTDYILKKKIKATEIVKMWQEIPNLFRYFMDGSISVYKYFTNTLTVRDFFNENNHEVRRRLLEKIPIEKIIKRLRLVSKDERGELYEESKDSRFRYWHVVCPSTSDHYLIAVPKDCKTPKEAFNWSFYFNTNDRIKILNET